MIIAVGSDAQFARLCDHPGRPALAGDPQVLHRGMCALLQAPWAAGGAVPSIRMPIRFSGAQLSVGRPSPRLGAHTEAILAGIGLAD